jgi:hypothetical protein
MKEGVEDDEGMNGRRTMKEGMEGMEDDEGRNGRHGGR